MAGRRQEYLEAMFEDRTGHVLMTIDRLGFGHDAEQAKASDAIMTMGWSWI